MKICGRCGHQNTSDAKKCANCFVDLHWAKVNLGKFTGTIDDTKRIGNTERKRLSIDDDNINSIQGAVHENQEFWKPIILLSLLSAPFFDFLAPSIGVPFWGGGCGGAVFSPILALIISLITGYLGWATGRNVLNITENNITKNIRIILIGIFCGFVAGILAALIYAPFAC